MRNKTTARILCIILTASLLTGCGSLDINGLIHDKLVEMAGKEDQETPVETADNTVTESLQDEEPVLPEEDSATADEPEQEAETGPDYEALYAPVLTETLNLIEIGVDDAPPVRSVPSAIVEMVMYESAEDLLKDIGYHIEDVSGDGIPELLMGFDADEMGNGDQSYVAGVFTIRDDELVLTIDGWARSSYRWMSNGQFLYLGSGGAAYTYIGKCHLSVDGTEAIWDDYYFSDPTEDGMDMKYYHNTTGSDEPGDSEEFDGDFWGVEEGWETKCRLLPWTPIGEYSAPDGADTAYGALDGSIQTFEIPDAGRGTVKFDLDGDGQTDNIDYEMTADEYDDVEYLDLYIGGDKLRIEEGLYCFASYGLTGYWITDDYNFGNQYLYIEYTTDGDHRDTAMYQYRTDYFEYLGDLDGIPLFGEYDEHHQFVSDKASTQNFLVQSLEQKLGTLSYTQRYRLDKYGYPDPVDYYRYYHTGSRAYISATKQIPCMFRDDEFSEYEEKASIKEGSMIIPYGTDGFSFIDLQVEGNEGLYRIYIDMDDSGYWYLSYKDGLIGSDLLTDCFSGMVFAG